MKHVLLIVLNFTVLSVPAAVTAQVQSLVASNTVFALNLYHQLAADPGSNIFFSPYSISTCMAMTYAGARGNTEAQMSQVLGFDTNQGACASAFGQLQSQLQSDQQTEAIELNIANALWTQVGFPFLPDFLQTATNQYQAVVNQSDFRVNPGAVSQAINDWVAQQTQNKIQNIVPPDAINPNTRLVLVNAIYFKGAWTYTFAETNTSLQPFYLSSSTQVEAPLMHQPLADASPPFKYMQTADLQALALPYGSNLLSMVILLPMRIDGLQQLEQQLSPSFLSNVLAQMRLREVEVFLPRFTNESSFDLKATLPPMGMSDAFSQGAADFSGMDGMHDLFLSFVRHKAWCQVDEAGTEAAAATAGGAVTSTPPPPPPTFRADHPFIFLIQDTQTGSLLFLGRLANPSPLPGSPVPVPRLALTRLGRMLTVSWPYPSTPWTLQQSTDPSSDHWTPIVSRGELLTGGPFTSVFTDGTNNFLGVAPSGNLFFRLSQH
jgi:serpin B